MLLPVWAVDRKCTTLKISHTAALSLAARVAKQTQVHPQIMGVLN